MSDRTEQLADRFVALGYRVRLLRNDMTTHPKVVIAIEQDEDAEVMVSKLEIFHGLQEREREEP